MGYMLLMALLPLAVILGISYLVVGKVKSKHYDATMTMMRRHGYVPSRRKRGWW